MGFVRRLPNSSHGNEFFLTNDAGRFIGTLLMGEKPRWELAIMQRVCFSRDTENVLFVEADDMQNAYRVKACAVEDGMDGMVILSFATSKKRVRITASCENFVNMMATFYDIPASVGVYNLD